MATRATTKVSRAPPRMRPRHIISLVRSPLKPRLSLRLRVNSATEARQCFCCAIDWSGRCGQLKGGGVQPGTPQAERVMAREEEINKREREEKKLLKQKSKVKSFSCWWWCLRMWRVVVDCELRWQKEESESEEEGDEDDEEEEEEGEDDEEEEGRTMRRRKRKSGEDDEEEEEEEEPEDEDDDTEGEKKKKKRKTQVKSFSCWWWCLRMWRVLVDWEFDHALVVSENVEGAR